MSKRLSWDDQRCFLAVLEAGSLSAAARNLGVTQPTVRARIEALEAALGTVLFTRSVNGLTPTDSARALREPARTMAMASARFVREASAAPGALAGTVRLSVPEFMGIEVLPPMLAKMRLSLPAIAVEMVLSNAPADLLAQEVDLAVRTFAPKQEALVAQKVGVIELGFFASRAYLDRRGTPVATSELADHDMIGPDRNRADLALAESMGLVFSANRLALRTDSHSAQLAAARAGLGIAVSQVPVAERDPALVRVLPEVCVAQMGVWVAMHENLRAVPRVKAVFNFLAEEFQRFTSPA
jgi:DNA-binding transcriptional LysR family regulator